MTTEIRKKVERYTVSQVARMAHVTVRTLHHYDEIGLLVPSERGSNGYRLYVHQDLARLQQILLFRQLDFTLEATRELIDAPAFDRKRALEAQRDLLVEERRRTDRVIRGVERALRALDEGRPMDEKEMFAGFEDFDAARYEDEARERWGESASYKESMRRTKSYSKSDWARIKNEGEDIWERMGGVMDAGESPDSAAAMDLAEEHRSHIDRWFYACSRPHHSALAQMYTADPRFTEYFERRHEGLAKYVQAAIEANGRRG